VTPPKQAQDDFRFIPSSRHGERQDTERVSQVELDVGRMEDDEGSFFTFSLVEDLNRKDQPFALRKETVLLSTPVNYRPSEKQLLHIQNSNKNKNKNHNSQLRRKEITYSNSRVFLFSLDFQFKQPERSRFFSHVPPLKQILHDILRSFR
jgi:hypothetical protein